MRLSTVAFALYFVSQLTWAASPEGAPDVVLPHFRVEAAEVHIAVSAFDNHNGPISTLSVGDLKVWQDGQPLKQGFTLQRRDQSAISATVLTDVSGSMTNALPMARDSFRWMATTAIRTDDHVIFRDFDDGMVIPGQTKTSAAHLTTLYDCLMQLIPQIGADETGRRALILFTDGNDNYSLHSLQQVIELAVQRDVAIYAITTYKFHVSYNYEVLDELTRQTGGQFFVVKNAPQMIASVKQIEQELRNGYELVFRADKARSGMRRLGIVSTHKAWRLYYRAAYYQPPASATGTIQIAAR